MKMNKKAFYTAAFVLLFIMTVLCGCGGKNAASGITESASNGAFVNTAESGDFPESTVGAEEMLSDEQALSAVRSYCCIMNPDLEAIVKSEEYPVYWEISSSDEQETVVLFRSYTGAQIRYYIDRITGNTYVTEYVPGITPEEQRSGESFNIRDYFSGD